MFVRVRAASRTNKSEKAIELVISKLYSSSHIIYLYTLKYKIRLDLESIGSSLRFEGELIWAGLDWRGHDISSGLVNRHLIGTQIRLIIEGSRGLRKL